MKNLKLFTILIFTLGFFSLNAQETYLNVENTPQQIQSYVKTHFPNHQIVAYKKDQGKRKLEYEVKLDGRIELEFDQNFQIKEIESKTELPKSVIPKKISAYVAENYPTNTIVEWKRKRENQKIELDNDWDLYFDFDGNFLKLKK